MTNPVVPLHEVTIQKPAFSKSGTRILQLYWYEATCDVCGKRTLAMYPDNSSDEYSSAYLCLPCLEGLFGTAQANSQT